MKPGNAAIINQSDFQINYKYGRGENIIAQGTLSPLVGTETFSREILQTYLMSYDNERRVSLKTEHPYENNDVCTFINRPSYAVSVKNALNETVTLRADGWIDDINLTDSISEQSS